MNMWKNLFLVYSNFKLFASVAPSHGIMKISVDGGEEQVVDCYSTVRKDGIKVFDSGELEEKEHIVKITVTGEKNAESSDYYVNVDNVAVIYSKELTIKEEKYSFPTDAVWSAGYENQGSTYEWAINSAPQCAHICI